MSRKARFTQADVTRAIRGAQAAGGVIKRITIEVDGTIVIDWEPRPSPEPDWRPESNLYRPLGLKRWNGRPG